MKLLCTASKVPWFTIGREYVTENGVRVEDNDRLMWHFEAHNGGYRTERLEDAEFSVAPGYEPATTAADAALFNEALLAAVVQMADEEGVRDSFDRHLATIRHRFGLLKNPQSQRAFLLALAYFAEEQSQ